MPTLPCRRHPAPRRDADDDRRCTPNRAAKRRSLGTTTWRRLGHRRSSPSGRGRRQLRREDASASGAAGTTRRQVWLVSRSASNAETSAARSPETPRRQGDQRAKPLTDCSPPERNPSGARFYLTACKPRPGTPVEITVTVQLASHGWTRIVTASSLAEFATALVPDVAHLARDVWGPRDDDGAV